MKESLKKLKRISYFILGISVLITTISMIMDITKNGINLMQDLIIYLLVYSLLLSIYSAIKSIM